MRLPALRCLLMVLIMGLPVAGYSQQISKRPNILFVIADDQSWMHTSIAGDKVVKTPAFDRVAREGVLVTHSFSASPSCTASRSAVLSGQDIWRLKEAGVLYGSIPPELKMYPQLLEAAGYHVGYTGKGWAPGNPNYQGFKGSPTGKEYNSILNEAVPKGIFKSDYAANFNAFLTDKPRDAPFCFWFGSFEPHRTYDEGIGLRNGKKLEDVIVPSFLPDTKEVRSDLLDYYFEIEWFDAQLEKMLQKLEVMGELDNTLIVVTADNGMAFPRAKTTLYDWGVRMPLAIRWGNKITGGRTIDDLVSHTDFAPTFLEVAGVSVPKEMTGKSLLPILFSKKQGVVDSKRDRVFTAIERHTICRPNNATYPIRAIRTRDFLYIRNFEPDRWPTGGPDFISSNNTYHGDVDAGATKTFMVLEENQKKYAKEYLLSFGKRPKEELYKISIDGDQVNNLAGNRAYDKVKKELSASLTKYLTETGDPRIRNEDSWQGYSYQKGENINNVLKH
jgi:N-sulfoglucosamine sulfohydrolase